VNLHRRPRRAHHEFIVGRGAYDTPIEGVGVLRATRREVQLREIEVGRMEPRVELERASIRGDRALHVLSRTVEVAEAAMARGVVGVSLRRAPRVADGFVVAIERERVLRHALQVRRRTPDVGLHEFREDLERPCEVAARGPQPLEREQRLDVPGRIRHEALQHALRIGGA
jgi:hypothetical protein